MLLVDAGIADALHDYYEIIWDEQQSHKFSALGAHLPAIKSFKTQ
ncbi:MAG: hypothetical protein HAW66_03910 [Shewanella sp.]|nr:hypothetical protein [Shewanella sp.]